jgi:hypothetical protein
MGKIVGPAADYHSRGTGKASGAVQMASAWPLAVDRLTQNSKLVSILGN